MPHSTGIEIFRDAKNHYHRVRLRRFVVAALAAAFVLVAAANAWWFSTAPHLPAMEKELEEAGKSREQLAQHLSRLERMSQDIREGVGKLQGSDAKLREMIRLDKEAKRAAMPTAPGQDIKREADQQLARLEAQEAYVRLLLRPTAGYVLKSADMERLASLGGQLLGAAPDAWPVEGVVSSRFGVRLSPFASQEEFHKGLDIMAPAGSPVRAPAPGRVAFSGLDPEGSLCVVLDHGGGYLTTFAHIRALAVKAGQDVARGDILGLVSQDGRSTGPHLHYEVRLYGAPVDPAKFLP